MDRNRLKQQLISDETIDGKPALVPYYLEYTDKETGKLVKEKKATAGYGHQEKYVGEFDDMRKAGTFPTTEEGWVQVLHEDIEIAIADAKSLIGKKNKKGKTHPPEVMEAFTNMAFQLGKPNLTKFIETIKFTKAGNYMEASIEMLDSDWTKKQTWKRANRAAQLFQDAAKKIKFTSKFVENSVAGENLEAEYEIFKRVTKENKKIARIESFYAQENLSKLANMTPAQAVEYHQGVYDKELAREKFARESVAGGDRQLALDIAGDIRETTDYYKFKFDAKTELPFFGDSTVSAGMTTYSSKADGYDPETEIRGAFTKKIGKDTSIDIYGSKTNESGQIGFKLTSKY